jgi:hypothetical protein
MGSVPTRNHPSCAGAALATLATVLPARKLTSVFSTQAAAPRLYRPVQIQLARFYVRVMLATQATGSFAPTLTNAVLDSIFVLRQVLRAPTPWDPSLAPAAWATPAAV